MARDKRVQKKGMHYISNRSVELRNIFIVEEDYQIFLEYLCKMSKLHKFTIHSYVLLVHSVYLLLETKKDNLSHIMKLLNSQYTNYFNLKYNRNGPLWEGRYKSSFIENHSYVYYFISFMENLPKSTGISVDLRSYHYSSYRQFIGLDKCLKCMQNSIIFKRFNTFEEIKIFLEKTYTKEFITNIVKILRYRYKTKDFRKKELAINYLDKYFSFNQTYEDELKSIFKAYINGFSQKKIGDFLGISQQAVAKRIKKYREKKGKR